ncbi:MAG: Gfo/Idh/MocA family oxidoreductase, partial [Planctomycetia bacterium]|nr:Gfo/Idh/MocA family oxidoreductase [Planctomycetia bacterium]
MVKISRRHFIGSGLAAGAMFSFPAPALIARGANEKIRVGGIGCGWRGGDLLSKFSKSPDAKVVALADPSADNLAAKRQKFPDIKGYQDLRQLIDDKNIDVVYVATCNHWHCLAAIWAMQAGKDVYVEKPLAHTPWEGDQVVLAARKYNKICQVGTQQRSDPMQAEIKKFLYEEKALGNILSARVNRYGVRASIGK